MKRMMNEYELDEFYKRIGAAVWNIQYLEDALVKYLFAKELMCNPIKTESEVYERLGKKQKMVLGRVFTKLVN